MLGKLWQQFKKRLKQAHSREIEQALVRSVIAFLLCFYALYLYFFSASDEPLETLLIIALVYGLSSLLIFLFIAWRPQRYHPRHTIVMLFDVGMITLAMWVGGEIVSMLYIFYFWVCLGNGILYGTPWLYLTSAFSSIGFSTVILVNDFWREQQILSIGLLVGLVITTLYVSLLLKQVEREKMRSEASNRAKSRFLANMSHEIRTPLNGVVGMTDLLAGTPMGAEQREIMAAIQASAETLLNLIEEILDFSKIEAGKVEINAIDQNISLLVDTVVSMMKPAADAKSIELKCWLDLDVSPVIKTDPKLLRQILINLLNNAIKYTDQGSIVLKVTPCIPADNDDSVPRLLFEVIDTGIGISEEQQQWIFERFRQADDLTTERYTGSGLGTTITKQLVELLGGAIGVESRLGEGSRFWFQIPALPADILFDKQQLQEARVLLFTDLFSQQQQLLDELQEWQVDVKVCSSIAEGFMELLNAVKTEEPYDIAIVDETQSASSSDELVRVIRSEKSLDDLGLICVTHHKPDRDRELAMCHEGYSAVVTMPVTMEKVHHVLQYALKYRQSDNMPPRIISSAEQGITKKVRILLAEDNQINQKVVKKILELQGHQVVVVGQGQEAIDILDKQDFDLAILDLHMPILGGIDVIKTYRRSHQGKNSLPFMILTANATPEAIQSCNEVGVDAYLTKPVRSTHLIEVVNEVLESSVARVSNNFLIDQPRWGRDQEKSARVIDMATIKGLEQLSQDPRFLGQLAESFLRDSETLLASMHQAMEDRSFHQYKDCAHALADNASGIGAYSLMTVCYAATHVEQAHFDEKGLTLLSKISSTFSVTSQALRQYLKANGGSLTST
jgi:two-component system sensor histidine kinase RpfC